MQLFNSYLTLFVVFCCLNEFALGANSYLKSKPDWIQTCELADPNFTQCSTKSVAGLFEKLKTGVSEFGLPQMDPLVVSEIKFSQGEGPVSLTASLHNATVTGLKGIQLLQNQVDAKTIDWTTHLKIPKLRIDGIYTAKGQILVVPIRGKGDSWFEVYDLDVHSFCDVGLRKKKDHLFYKVKSASVDFTFQDLKFYLSNLFEGQKDLEIQTNKYLNDNWREVAPIIQPVIKKTIEEISLTFLKQFFDNCPAEYFVKDLPTDNLEN